MTTQEIKLLIDRYFEGETNLEEERLLKVYFSSDEIAPEIRHYKPWFSVLQSEKNRKMPNFPTEMPKKAPNRRIWLWAASILLAGSCLFMGIQNYQNQQKKAALTALEKDTYDDPEKAYQEIKAALALVSQKMNKGKNVAQIGMEKTKTLNGVCQSIRQKK